MVRGTRQASDSPSPTPARGFAPVLPPRCSASGFLRVSWATAARIREPGLPSPFWHGGVGGRPGAKEKAPAALISFPFAAGGPGSRAHLSAGEAADWAAPQSFGGRLEVCALRWGFSSIVCVYVAGWVGWGGSLRDRP